MKIVVLERDTFGVDLDLESLEYFSDITIYNKTKPSEILERVIDAEVIIVNKLALRKPLLEKLRDIKHILVTATGTDNIDMTFAESFGISVKNVVGYATNSVAQHTLGMGLCHLQNLREYHDIILSKKWSKSELFTNHDFPYWEFGTLSWGIIGLGSIGTKVAELTQALGFNVQYYSTSGKNTNSDFKRCESLKEILESSDIISLHCPLNKDTEYLLNLESLSWMRDRAVLINMARGKVINEFDLIEHMEQSSLRVGLDVFENEPIDEFHPFIKLDYGSRILLTPHNAWASKEARLTILETIRGYLEEICKI